MALAVLAAAMLSADVVRAMMRIMVAAVGRVAGLQRARQQAGNCRIRIALHAAVDLDAKAAQRNLRAAANAAANQVIHTVHHQETRQQAVAAASRIDDLRGDDLAFLDLVKLKLGAMAKVLINLSVIVCNCNLHLLFLLFFSLPQAIPAAIQFYTPVQRNVKLFR